MENFELEEYQNIDEMMEDIESDIMKKVLDREGHTTIKMVMYLENKGWTAKEIVDFLKAVFAD